MEKLFDKRVIVYRRDNGDYHIFKENVDGSESESGIADELTRKYLDKTLGNE